MQPPIQPDAACAQPDHTMRAIQHDRYGALDTLRLRDIAPPAIGDDQVLVQVQAAGLHIGDCFGIRGTPLPVRAVTGLFQPRPGIPGRDVAGRIVAIGKHVTQFQPGDEVFGECPGACAEYTSATPDKLALKPANLRFVQAAALPTSALAALHALRDVGKVAPGQRILINGASGGIGTFAVQIAKSLGAEVTGVCSTPNVAMLHAIGADHVIDYTRDDFNGAGQHYDLLLDNVENRSLADCRRALRPEGMLILNSGTGAQGFAFMQRLIQPLLMSPFISHTLRRYLSVPNHRDLVVLKELAELGHVTPVIDQIYPLSQTAAALAHIETGHARGKVVVTP